MSAIAPLTREHVDIATTTITRAFASDPVFEWVLPDPSTRGRRLARLNRVPLEFGLRSGRVMQSHDGGAVAIWVPPGPGVTAGGLIRCGLLGAPFHLGLGAFSRFMAANGTMEAIHKKHVAEPHWYLMIVAVDPSLHGRGIGRLGGFEVLETVALGNGGPRAWAMSRAATSAGRLP